MIALTGAGGFIGSVILGYLNKKGIKDICLFDDLPGDNQFKNLVGKDFSKLYSVKENKIKITDFDAVIHFGANSSTLEKDWSKIYDSNVLSTRYWHTLCLESQVKFIYASSAAVYGNGKGPLNHYAFSKQISENEITNGVVLRLFNVYGPNEYHKGRMASTPFHWYNQLRNYNKLTIFENSDQYFRDFIWVEDVAATVYHFINNYKQGVYDLGTGTSTSFDIIADICLTRMAGNKEVASMPEDLKAQYQKNTCANIDSLKIVGVNVDNFVKSNEGITEYFGYLKNFTYY